MDLVWIGVGIFAFMIGLGFVIQKVTGRQVYHGIPNPVPLDPHAERVPCPTCKELVHREASICPFCHQGILSHNPHTHHILMLGLAVLLIGVIWWALTVLIP